MDKFTSVITEYTIKITSLQISEKEHAQATRLIQVVNDIERISDYCENISEYAQEMAEKKLYFSEMAQAEMKEMIQICFDSYKYAMDAFMEENKEKAVKAIEKETLADELEIKLRSKHIKRLTNNEYMKQGIN